MGDEHVDATSLPHLNRATLERLDERTAAIQEDISELRKELRNTYATQESVKAVQKAVEKCVTKEEFAPVKRLVYGMVGLILTGVVVAILGIILTH